MRISGICQLSSWRHSGIIGTQACQGSNGRLVRTKSFKTHYPGKKAVFDAMREKLGVGSSFTCRGSNGRQSAREQTYKITAYGFEWAEEAIPMRPPKGQTKR